MSMFTTRPPTCGPPRHRCRTRGTTSPLRQSTDGSSPSAAETDRLENFGPCRCLRPDNGFLDFIGFVPAGHSPTAVVAGGSAFCHRRFLTSGPSDAVYEYDAVNAVWLARAAMPTPRHEHTSVVLDGVIYVIGGSIGGMGIATVEAYDPQTDTWESKSDMPAVRASHAAASYRNTVYVFGGRETSAFQSPLATVASYAPISD